MHNIYIYEVLYIGCKQAVCKYIRNMSTLNQCPVYTKGQLHNMVRPKTGPGWLIAPLASVQLLVSSSEPTGKRYF